MEDGFKHCRSKYSLRSIKSFSILLSIDLTFIRIPYIYTIRTISFDKILLSFEE